MAAAAGTHERKRTIRHGAEKRGMATAGCCGDGRRGSVENGGRKRDTLSRRVKKRSGGSCAIISDHDGIMFVAVTRTYRALKTRTIDELCSSPGGRRCHASVQLACVGTQYNMKRKSAHNNIIVRRFAVGIGV